MRFRIGLPTLTLLVAIAAAGCNSDTPGASSGDGPALPSGTGHALPPDDEILAKLYDPGYSAPGGFYVDERAHTPGSYSLHHVKDPSVSFELCTDDFTVAAGWEAADNSSRQVNGYYVGHVENARYFEFVRELSYGDSVGNVGDPTSQGFARVLKCSYATRDGVDASLLTGYAGKLNLRPLDEAALREFVEYFWQFTFFNARAKKVLASYGSAREGELERTLLLAFATARGGRCDRVEVVEWRFVTDADTGEVHRQFETVHRFAAEVVAGVPRICADAAS